MRKTKTQKPKADEVAIKAIELRAFRLAQVAASLMSSRVQHFFQQGHPRDFTDETWDLEFNSALKRAEMLMRSTMERDSDIHAYQVFREGDVLTEEQIADEFKRVLWAGLKSKLPITNLMRELKVLMEKHFEDEAAHNPFSDNQEPSDALKEVASYLEALIVDSLIEKAIPDFRKIANQFMDLLSLSIPQAAFGQTYHEWMATDIENSAFMLWCFPFEESSHGAVRKYRAHEIFRFAAKMKWREKELMITLSSLDSSFIPFPQRAHSDARFEKFDRAHHDADAYWPEKSDHDPVNVPKSGELDGEAPLVAELADESLKAGKLGADGPVGGAIDACP